MKKSIIIAAASAALLTACQPKAPKANTLNEFYTQRIEAAKNFQDSLIATDGSFIGGVFGSQVSSLEIENPDRNEILRGMRDAVAVDTANESYIAGLRMGIQIWGIYKQLAQDEPVSKERLISTIAEAFNVDTINSEDLQKLEPLFQQMFQAVKDQARKREDAKIFNTRAAVQNRIIGDANAEKYQANPDFVAVGNDGLMMHVITPGDGEVINPNSPIIASIYEYHADSKHQYRGLGDTPMLAGRPNHPVLSSVIPYMSVGETAEFFVPYTLAYGVAGNEDLGVGPCESVICTVTIKPFDFAAAK